MRVLSALVLVLAVVCFAAGVLGQPVQDRGEMGFNNPTCTLDDLQLPPLVIINNYWLNTTFGKQIPHYTCSCKADYNGPVNVQVILTTGGSHADVYWNGAQVGTSLQGAQGQTLTSLPIFFTPGSNVVQVVVSYTVNPDMGTLSPCQYTYTMSCWKETDTSVHGDPQFVGLRGQDYQVHGVSGEVYNIVSDPAFQINSRFIFLDHGECPIIDGKKQKGCWSHPGSYLGEIGIKTQAGDKIHLVSGKAKDGFKRVLINDQEMEVGDVAILNDDMGYIAFNTTHMVDIQLNNWSVLYENSDNYINQQVSVTHPHTLRSHGLLGQTWRDVTYPNPIKHIQGSVDDYVIRDGDLFGDKFLYNMFN